MSRRFVEAHRRTTDQSGPLAGIATVVLPDAQADDGRLPPPLPLASVSYSGVTLLGSTGACRTRRSIGRANFAV